MMKCWTTLASALPFALCAVAAVAAAPQSSSSSGIASSFYDLKTSYLDGKPADLGGVFRGKVSLVVNVASKCGFTPQYEGLEQLNRELAGKGFAVLGVSQQRLRRPGARHGEGNRRLLQAHLRCDVSDVLEARDEARIGAVAHLQISGDVGAPSRLEFQQVRHRQGRPDHRLLSERRDTGIAGAPPRDHEGARQPNCTVRTEERSCYPPRSDTEDMECSTSQWS